MNANRLPLVLLLSAGLCIPDAAAQAPQIPGVGAPDGAELLVKRITDELKQVDAALARASEAETVAGDVSAAKASHVSVIRDIEALIKQVKYQKSQNSSGGGGGESSSQGEGLSGKPESRPSDGSSAPKPSGGKSQEQGGQAPKDGTKDGAQGERKDGKQPLGSAQPDAGPGGNEQTGKLPPPDAVDRFTRTDTDARWGVLPPKLQERLMNLHVDDVPERYRVWLEAYIRALNAREQEGSGR